MKKNETSFFRNMFCEKCNALTYTELEELGREEKLDGTNVHYSAFCQECVRKNRIAGICHMTSLPNWEALKNENVPLD